MFSGLRPQKIQNCPRLFSLLYERLIDAPNKRPTMSQILNIFENLNKIINKVPVAPIINNTSTTPTIRSRSIFSSSYVITKKLK